MKILVLGGDGYLGWPISCALAAKGHEVTIMDNLAKRKWEMECGSVPLFEVLPLHRRTSAFKQTSGKELKYFIGDITNVGAIYHIFDLVKPDTVIRCSGQPSAPFSMKNRVNSIITQESNYLGALNILFAVQRSELPVHLISLGSTGVYGTPDVPIREGYLDVELNGKKDKLPFPLQPGSFLELAEASATNAMNFACRNWGHSITEIRLGVVYGFETEETSRSAALATSFYYDAVFGTVVNRCTVQAAIGYPLTVYGSGGQKRSFLSLTDVVKGVEYVVEKLPEKGHLRIIHHFSETMTILELAKRIQDCAKRAGLRSEIKHLPNHRIEKEDPFYSPERLWFNEMGFPYSTLEDVLNTKYFFKMLEEKDRIDLTVMDNFIPWKKH